MTVPAELSQTLKSAAIALGFDLVGIAPAVTPLGFTRLQEWLQRGYAGEMSYLPRREAAYEHPRHVLDGVRSVVMVAVNYKSAEPPKDDAASGDQSSPTPAQVAKYARGPTDYHDVLKDRLRQLADVLHERVSGCRTRCVVDTAPLLERDFAQLAGLGWFGKNTLLIHKRAGSFLLLGALLTDVELEPDQPHDTSHCGTCTRCLDVCPTDAFPAPYVLDARKCISYLTIELKGAIPRELRTGIGDWLFGCDLCQD
ncbi:MAG: tRNA epoxyqueuosine(34) reductase QueG, partial [Planctomycetaceae bacterium]|nr:tRNA epoxyqueuosine(34) reductase QueG [Planctomycetaceae bacterium]